MCYPTRVLGWHGPARKPANVWAVAFREECKPPTAAEYETFGDCSSVMPASRCRGAGS